MAEFTTLPDAIARNLRDGDRVAMEGFTHLIPYAAGHEAIRQGRTDLTLIRMTPDILYDQLIGMGLERLLRDEEFADVGSFHAARPGPFVLVDTDRIRGVGRPVVPGGRLRDRPRKVVHRPIWLAHLGRHSGGIDGRTRGLHSEDARQLDLVAGGVEVHASVASISCNAWTPAATAKAAASAPDAT